MLTNALIKTYLFNKSNMVHVFVTPEIKSLLIAQNPESERLSYHVWDAGPVNSFINSMNEFGLDRIHLASVSNYYKAFYQFEPSTNCQVYFHFHNIDVWFKSAFYIQAKRLYDVFSNFNKDVEILRNIKYSLKIIWKDYYCKRLIRKVGERYKLVILSEAQRYHLGKYLDATKAFIFPTLVFEPGHHQDLSLNNEKIRICVPGSVAQIRREYNKLLDVIEKDVEFYSSHFIFDFLGFFPKEEATLKQRVNQVKSKGVQILTYDYFIDVNVFDLELYKCDYILSNILIDEGKSVQNKETAAVFHMVRGAKPGIFPSGFVLDKEFIETVLYFKDYNQIDLLFRELASNKYDLRSLREKAMKLSLKYAPEHLLPTLNQ